MNTQRKKRCVVKCCKNTNSNAPEKLFLNLPPAEPGAELTERRMKWEQALENRLSSWSRSSYDKICEDHFNLQEDSSNWMRYKTVGCNIQLKPEVVPHLYMDNPPTYALKSQLSESDQKRRTEFLLSFKKQSSSRSQSSPRTKIPDTPMLMQIDAIKLPTTFDYSKISENTYRANLLSENDIKIWIKEFEKLTSTSWIIILHKNNTPHLVSSYVFYCHHTGYRRVTPSNNKKGKSKNFDCRANIKIRIKMTTKNTIRKDKFVKDGMPATIVFNYNHNHDLNSAETLSYLPPSKEIRQEFEKYFEDGSSIKEAINYHKSKLELKYGPESAELVNSQINPKYRSVQFWFEEWRTKNLGPRSGDGVVQLEPGMQISTKGEHSGVTKKSTAEVAPHFFECHYNAADDGAVASTSRDFTNYDNFGSLEEEDDSYSDVPDFLPDLQPTPVDASVVKIEIEEEPLKIKNEPLIIENDPLTSDTYVEPTLPFIKEEPAEEPDQIALKNVDQLDESERQSIQMFFDSMARTVMNLSPSFVSKIKSEVLRVVSDIEMEANKKKKQEPSRKTDNVNATSNETELRIEIKNENNQEAEASSKLDEPELLDPELLDLDHDANYEPLAKKKKIEQPSSSLQVHRTPRTLHEPVETFFQSIAYTVKSFPLPFVCKAKVAVLKVISKMEVEACRSHQSGYTDGGGGGDDSSRPDLLPSGSNY